MKINKKKISIFLNLTIVIMEIIAFIVTIQERHKITFEFYTEESNILALVTSLLFLIYLLKNNKVPKWLGYLKYMSTIALVLTILVVIFILCPDNDFNFGFMLFYKSLLVHHFLAPIISFITFVFFDEIKVNTIKENFIGVLFTLLYGIVIIPLNIIRVIEGPYPFLLVYEQPVWKSIIWVIFLLGFAYIIGLVIRKLQNLFNK